MNLPLKGSYKHSQITDFFAECACIVGDKVVSGERKKDKVFDAVVISFVNIMYFGDYAMYTKDMYSEEYRNKEDVNIPQTCDVKNIILLGKLHYLRQISYTNENFNSPEKMTRQNEHMHEDLRKCKFNDEDVLNYVDEFLIFSGKCRGVEIDKADLKSVEETFCAEQNAEEPL